MRVHHGPATSAIGASAFTLGEDIYFSPDGVASETIAAAPGDRPALDVVLGGAAGDPTRVTYAWYTSIDALNHYRSATAILDADQPGAGTAVAVVRDGGGAWQQLPVQIQ